MAASVHQCCFSRYLGTLLQLRSKNNNQRVRSPSHVEQKEENKEATWHVTRRRQKKEKDDKQVFFFFSLATTGVRSLGLLSGTVRLSTWYYRIARHEFWYHTYHIPDLCRDICFITYYDYLVRYSTWALPGIHTGTRYQVARHDFWCRAIILLYTVLGTTWYCTVPGN